jgi:hypothetical protein
MPYFSETGRSRPLIAWLYGELQCIKIVIRIWTRQTNIPENSKCSFKLHVWMGPFQALGNNTKKRLTKTTFTKQTFSKFVHLISLPCFCLDKNLKSSFTFICTNLFHIQHLSIDLLSAYWIIPPHSLTQKANVISFEKLYVFGGDIAQLIALVLFELEKCIK